MDIVRDFINKKLKLTIDSDVVDDFSEIEKWVHIDVAPAKHFKIFLLKIQIQVILFICLRFTCSFRIEPQSFN